MNLADLFAKTAQTASPQPRGRVATQEPLGRAAMLGWTDDFAVDSPAVAGGPTVAEPVNQGEANGHTLTDLFAGSPFSNLQAVLNVDLFDEGVRLIGEGLDDPYILRAVFVVGAGGSGKSTIADEMFGGRGLKRVNQDAHLERITQAQGRDLKDVGLSYADFKKAQALARMERDQWAERRLGMVIDATGWEYRRVAEPMKRLRDEFGYDCTMVFVTTSLDTALDRNDARAAAGGRKVPDWSIEKAHTGVHANLLAYRKLFGKGNLIVVKNDADIEPDEWARTIAPELYRIGAKLIDRPLKNPVGRAWVRKQLRAMKVETRDRPTIVIPAGLFDSDLPCDSLSLDEAPASDATLDRPFSKDEDGDSYIVLDGEQIGQIQYFYDRSTKRVDISYVGVRSAFRRGGHALAALRQFVAQARKAGVKGITSEPVWQGSLDMLMRVLGKPSYLGDDLKQYGVNQARKRLPSHQVEDPDGTLSGGTKMYARWDW